MSAETRAAPPRRYHSPRRAQQAAETRQAVLSAATELFSTRGWAATSVREVAAAAGVSVETVYAGYGSKVELLLAAVDVGVVGDGEQVALVDRPEFASLASGPLSERVAAAARLTAAVNLRTAALHRALREAAGQDPANAGARLRRLEEDRRATVEQGLARVTGRPVMAEERDGVWALTSAEVFSLLTEVSGWAIERYEAWVGDAVLRLLGDLPTTHHRR